MTKKACFINFKSLIRQPLTVRYFFICSSVKNLDYLPAKSYFPIFMLPVFNQIIKHYFLDKPSFLAIL
jgi:hypothetical protein